ncbi:MAG: hypothetical protein MMC33_001718 [Icmadophila ericetorum]|nr:hypothetical protein [Icmadophila ericetorum]
MANQDTNTTNGESTEEPFPWHLGVFDAHCHPTDTVASLQDIPNMSAKALIIMATRAQDQDLVSQFANHVGYNPQTESAQCRVIPSFGWHPWFSYQIYDDTTTSGETTQSASSNRDNHYRAVLTSPSINSAFLNSLPEPRPLSIYLSETETYLQRYPLALVGEIGIDRSFRLPNLNGEAFSHDPSLTPGGREGRKLTPHKVSMDHQCKIFKAQLKLAGKMQRAVSVHGVAAHGALFETLKSTWKGHEREVVSKRVRKRRMSVKGAHDHEADQENGVSARSGPKPFPPRICLHSFSGPLESIKPYLNPSIPADIFFSFSQVINFSTPAAAKAEEVIKAVPKDRILVESDLHCAGERMDGLLEGMCREICRIKGWGLEKGVLQLGWNWKHFALGVLEEGEVVEGV